MFHFVFEIVTLCHLILRGKESLRVVKKTSEVMKFELPCRLDLRSVDIGGKEESYH